MKVYISGPITGVKGYMKHFADAEAEVMAAGYTAINPAKVNAMLPPELSHADYMATSIAMLSICDVIYMLPGWQESRGCSIEFEYAYENGITICFARQQDKEALIDGVEFGKDFGMEIAPEDFKEYKKCVLHFPEMCSTQSQNV